MACPICASVSGIVASGERIGLVPTMGALHAGHNALIEAAGRDCTRLVATIFVNPIQFNDKADLADYPSRETEDLALLAAAGCDLVYMPDLATMYPEGFATQVSVGGGLGDCLCGATRPGHMEGVATVVTKLFVQTLPDAAYFGEKDYQQLLIINKGFLRHNSCLNAKETDNNAMKTDVLTPSRFGAGLGLNAVW